MGDKNPPISLQSWCLMLVLFMIWPATLSSHNQQQQEEEFSEELLIKPLPDRKVLTHFHFQTSVSNLSSSSDGGTHLRLFPKSLYHLIHKFCIKEMELSFTQGRWNYERWGGFDPISTNNAKPPGVELRADFDAPSSQVNALWKNLTHALSGLFCASINFLDSSASNSAPDWGFQTSSGSLRRGMLPREAVCTENLTPWLKLLPCRDKAGLSELMKRRFIYHGFYHSQRLHLVSSGLNLYGFDSEVQLEQTLTVVLQPADQPKAKKYSDGFVIQPNWSLSSIFGAKVNSRCTPAKSSNIYLMLDRNLVSALKDMGIYLGNANSKNAVNNTVFELSTAPDQVMKEVGNLKIEEASNLYLYMIEKHVGAKSFDFSLTWKVPVMWSCSQAPIHVSRFLTGTGNERGAIVISLKTTGLYRSACGTGMPEDSSSFHINIFQVVPWYVKVYYHSLQVFLDGHIQPATYVIEKIHVVPSEDKVSFGSLELALKLPRHMKSATLSLDFEKGFLHIDEYPPDANQGFDIPSAVISFPDFHSSLPFVKDTKLFPLLSRLKKKSIALAYTEPLLVLLASPDFSMPYVVITVTCTIFHFYFKSLLGVWHARKDKAKANKTGRSTKSFVKFASVALAAVAWQCYFR